MSKLDNYIKTISGLSWRITIFILVLLAILVAGIANTCNGQTLTLINESKDTIEVDIYENERYFGTAKVSPGFQSTPIYLSLFMEYRISAKELRGTIWREKKQVFTAKDFTDYKYFFRITYHNINKA